MDVDERLRTAAAALEPRLDPAPPSIDAVAARHRRRRVRRVVIVLVVLGLTGAFAIAGSRTDENTLRTTSSSTSTSSAGTGPVIPWIDQPETIPTGPPPGPATTSPVCTAVQLRVGGSSHGAGAGSSYEQITLVNASRSTCSLSPALTAAARGPNAPTLPIQAAPGDQVQAGDVAPGATAMLRIQSQEACGPGGEQPATPRRIYTSLRIDLAGTASSSRQILTVPLPSLDGTCGGMSISGLTTLTAPTTTVPDPPAVKLQGAILDVGSVRPGGVLHYVVALTNTGAQPVPLTPCPSYYEKFGPFLGDTPPTVPTYQLNCAIASIAPGATVRFDMVLAIPATVPPGPENIEWGWLPPLADQPPPPQATFVIDK